MKQILFTAFFITLWICGLTQTIKTDTFYPDGGLALPTVNGVPPLPVNYGRAIMYWDSTNHRYLIFKPEYNRIDSLGGGGVGDTTALFRKAGGFLSTGAFIGFPMGITRPVAQPGSVQMLFNGNGNFQYQNGNTGYLRTFRNIYPSDDTVQYASKRYTVTADSADVWTALSGKEGSLPAGTTSQYIRGDKTVQTLNTTVVPEGVNQYFNNLRAQAAISVLKAPLSYNAGVVDFDSSNWWSENRNRLIYGKLLNTQTWGGSNSFSPLLSGNTLNTINATPAITSTANNQTYTIFNVDPTLTLGSFSGQTVNALSLRGNIVFKSAGYNIGDFSNLPNLYASLVIPSAIYTNANTAGNRFRIYGPSGTNVWFDNTTRNTQFADVSAFTDNGAKVSILGNQFPTFSIAVTRGFYNNMNLYPMITGTKSIGSDFSTTFASRSSAINGFTYNAGSTGSGNSQASIKFTGGTGTGAEFFITVTSGAVNSVIKVSSGSGYTAGDVLTAPTYFSQLGITGFSITIATLGIIDQPRTARFGNTAPVEFDSLKLLTNPTFLAAFDTDSTLGKVLASSYSSSGASGLDPTYPVSTGGTPTVSNNAGAAISAISVSGTNASLKLSFTVPSGQTVNGYVCTVTYAGAWSAAPKADINASFDATNISAIGTQIAAGEETTTTFKVRAYNLSAGTYIYTIKSIQ